MLAHSVPVPFTNWTDNKIQNNSSFTVIDFSDKRFYGRYDNILLPILYIFSVEPHVQM